MREHITQFLLSEKSLSRVAISGKQFDIRHTNKFIAVNCQQIRLSNQLE